MPAKSAKSSIKKSAKKGMAKAASSKLSSKKTAVKVSSSVAEAKSVRKKYGYSVLVLERHSEGTGVPKDSPHIYKTKDDALAAVDTLHQKWANVFIGPSGRQWDEWKYDARAKWKSAAHKRNLGEHKRGKNWRETFTFDDCWTFSDGVTMDCLPEWSALASFGGSLTGRFGADDLCSGFGEVAVLVNKVEVHGF
eukprot:gnl/MRDRNA2_/MRDRNA2_140342_c0_seq1.p1 gnl/MRDRNA2_/MRDRNA2_140342_c0~~gnl/MRDRNA2_/MRDRNA2_140342_c0_seq1.p1  ORF type:complete len:194 (+),score=42.76 gnl/MRDRNA2_/MRDRNA2_140342_c0_seq1:196-777(+)